MLGWFTLARGTSRLRIGGAGMIRIVASDPTPEELEAALSNPDAFYEVVDGEIVEKPQMSAFSRWIALRLYESLRDSARAGGLGVAVHEVMLVLDPARPLKRQPDV